MLWEASPIRVVTVKFLQRLEHDASFRIIGGNDSLYDRGFSLYAARPDPFAGSGNQIEAYPASASSGTRRVSSRYSVLKNCTIPSARAESVMKTKRANLKKKHFTPHTVAREPHRANGESRSNVAPLPERKLIETK